MACDENGRIEETNAALRELVGRSEEALRGRPLAELLGSAGERERPARGAGRRHCSAAAR